MRLHDVLPAFRSDSYLKPKKLWIAFSNFDYPCFLWRYLQPQPLGYPCRYSLFRSQSVLFIPAENSEIICISHDKQLIFIIKRILKAPIRMPDATTLIPDKSTRQGGIISPLLANIVLNELDKWVESQWQNHPLVKEYGYERKIRNSITFDRSKAFLKMRKTGLKEMYIVRYADDFRILRSEERRVGKECTG